MKINRNIIFLDFEFNNVVEELVNLVCCTTLHSNGELKEWWLHKNNLKVRELAQYILRNKDAIFCGYAMVAEFRSIMALGLNPSELASFDLFIEYRMLTNHNDELLYGEQLVNGRVKNTRKPPPKWERTEEDSQNSFKPTHSLAEATFKLTGEIRDTEHKNLMRDIIISGDEEKIEANKKDIQAYCTEDVVHLPKMLERTLEEYAALGFEYDSELESEMLLRGKYSALTAKMESRGYPIDYNKTKNFSSAVGPLLEEAQREINELFPDIKPFRYDRKKRRFSMNQKSVKEWIRDNADVERWQLTDGYKTAKKNILKAAQERLEKEKNTKRKLTAKEKEEALENFHKHDYLSLSLDAWTNQFDFKHSYPKNNFGAQMVRYLKLKQNLNGFVPNAKGSFWDAVGSDGRVRPYFNHYGSLSGRSQPGSKSFLHLKPAWMRSLCVPKKGRSMGAIDYGSQEYLLSALISECEDMVEAYHSGDVYMAFAKAAGMIPPDGKKEDYKKERQLAKAAVLGMSYLMTCIGLSAKLTADTGELVTEEDAQEIIDNFYEAYPELGKWQEKIQIQYKKEGHLRVPCGWTLFGDNDNFRSVVNFNIQGLGASILRKAVEFCDEAGLEVVITLHDAIYIEYDEGDIGALDTLYDCMKRAFLFYFPEQQEDAAKIRMDIDSWGDSFPESKLFQDKGGDWVVKNETILTPKGRKVSVSKVYIDERSANEYKQFSKYFENREENEL